MAAPAEMATAPTGSVPSAAAARVPAATAAAAGSVPSATAAARVPAAVRLREHRRGAEDDRPQNAGRQKKAFALGTHDECHLRLPAAVIRNYVEPIYLRPTLYNAVRPVWCT